MHTQKQQALHFTLWHLGCKSKPATATANVFNYTKQGELPLVQNGRRASVDAKASIRCQAWSFVIGQPGGGVPSEMTSSSHKLQGKGGSVCCRNVGVGWLGCRDVIPAHRRPSVRPGAGDAAAARQAHVNHKYCGHMHTKKQQALHFTLWHLGCKSKPATATANVFNYTKQGELPLVQNGRRASVDAKASIRCQAWSFVIGQPGGGVPSEMTSSSHKLQGKGGSVCCRNVGVGWLGCRDVIPAHRRPSVRPGVGDAAAARQGEQT